MNGGTKLQFSIVIVCVMVLEAVLSVETTDSRGQPTVVPAISVWLNSKHEFSSRSFIVKEMRVENEDVQFKENI